MKLDENQHEELQEDAKRAKNQKFLKGDSFLLFLLFCRLSDFEEFSVYKCLYLRLSDLRQPQLS